MPDTALATTQSTQSFAPQTLKEAFQFADMVLMSGMAPKSYTDIFKDAKDGPEKDRLCEQARSAVVVALQLGLEVGFQPMQALQSIANINGMPSIWGDGALGLVKSKGVLEYIKEDDFDTIKTNKAATCVVKRKGEPNEHKVTFSYEDAKEAKIFDRGVWKTYPYRMCMMRARAFALRNVFPDVLKGLHIREEVEDYQTIDATPSQPKPQGQVEVPKFSPQTIAATVTPDKREDDQPAATAEAQPVDNPDAEPAPTDDPEMVKALAEEARKWATAFYAAYKSLAKNQEELAALKELARGFIQKHFNVTDSRQVPVDKREFAMEQARNGFACMKES